jgi:hypothetical protein
MRGHSEESSFFELQQRGCKLKEIRNKPGRTHSVYPVKLNLAGPYIRSSMTFQNKKSCRISKKQFRRLGTELDSMPYPFGRIVSDDFSFRHSAHRC